MKSQNKLVKIDVKNFKVMSDNFPEDAKSLIEFCYYLKNKNIVSLHLLEDYLGVDMDSNEKLQEIRKIILGVSGSINRLPYHIYMEDVEDEKL